MALEEPGNRMSLVSSTPHEIAHVPANDSDWLPLPFRGDASPITSTVTGNSYYIDQQIGEGAFGIVFSCIDTWENDLVIKVLKPSTDDQPSVQDHAIKELQALVLVRHPYVVHVHDAFELDGACCIVSDRCHETLHDFVGRPNFSPHIWFKGLARCLLQAVHFTHCQNFVHCDIHEGNVFVRFTPDEIAPEQFSAMQFKLGDFGLARMISAITPEATFLNAIRPPEAMDSEFGPVDHRVDVYQTGLLFMRFLLGPQAAFTQQDLLDGRPAELALQQQQPLFDAIAGMLFRHSCNRAPNALAAWNRIRLALSD